MYLRWCEVKSFYAHSHERLTLQWHSPTWLKSFLPLRLKMASSKTFSLLTEIFCRCGARAATTRAWTQRSGGSSAWGSRLSSASKSLGHTDRENASLTAAKLLNLWTSSISSSPDPSLPRNFSPKCWSITSLPRPQSFLSSSASLVLGSPKASITRPGASPPGRGLRRPEAPAAAKAEAATWSGQKGPKSMH